MSKRDFSGRQVSHYLLMSPLGSGTGGSVYLAVDVTSLNFPTYAIKCVPESENLQRRRQQLAEIENHDAAISSPHVLMLCDAFKEDDYFFLVLALCEMDMSTAIFIKQLYWRNDALIRKVFVEILDGVLSCHEKGIFHRDLKPENIMCDTEGTGIQIGDFGLSTKRRLCRDGGCGTAPYMSPECFDEKEFCYDANQADIWSLGVILFNMVTNRYPWGEARVTDRDYTAFVMKKDHLLRTFPISASLSWLLRQIWHPTPMKRMSIPGIRQAIMEIDTFYRPSRRVHVPSPLSKEVMVVLVDSEQTRVAPMEDEKKKQSRNPIDALEDKFRRLELVIHA